VLSLDTSYDDEDVGEGTWIVEGNEFPIYLMEEPDWSQYDTTKSGNIGRHVLFGILRSGDITSVCFTYTDPSFLRIDFGDGSAEFFNIMLQELDDFVNEFVEFPVPTAIPLQRRGGQVDWKREGF
jgi:hypothetical protein